MYINYNANPINRRTGDCAIRAISTILDEPWEKVYMDICLKGYELHDMPDSKHVCGAYLTDRGFRRFIIPNTCPDCATIKTFCADHPQGRFIVVTDGHAVAVIDGNYYDTWDSGNEIPVYYWKE